MLRSMTGFGAAASDDGSLRVELRSVNHRHLQTKIRVPHEHASLEPAIDKTIKRRLERGSVSCAVIRAKGSSELVATIDHDAAGRAHGELVKLARHLGLDAPDLEDVLGVPGVVVHKELEPDSDVSKTIDELVGRALDSLVGMREAEGQALKDDLALHARRLGEVASKIAERAPVIVADHHRALTTRVQELLEKSGHTRSLEPADLAREVALLSDKLDVSEELSRLTSHLGQFDALLSQGGAIGRKLEFLIQELLREVNTIGSKASDAEVAQWVVEGKSHVERLREQAANVE